MTPNPAAALRDLLDIPALEAAFGIPEYGFFKCHCTAHTYKRKTSHTRGSWAECTEEEFSANYEASRLKEIDRFMGRYHGSFWIYEKRVKKAGWPQELMKMLKDEHPHNKP